jgi:hypothetical protein
MAGRPVAARATGGGGLLYGLISFSVLSVISLGGMIFALTNLKRAQEEAARFKGRLDQYGSPPAYFTDEAAARRSPVFAVMKADLDALAQMVTGKPDGIRPAIESEVRRMVSAVRKAHPEAVRSDDEALLVSLQGLDRALTDLKRRSAELSAQVAQLQESRDALTEGLRLAREEFESQVRQLAAEVDRIQQEKSAALEAKDRQLSSLQASSEAQAREWNSERTQIANERRENEVLFGRLRKQIGDLQEQVKVLRADAFDPQAILAKADGRILRAIPASDIVYIDIGSRDGLKAGTGFEVIADTPSPGPVVRGKASLEVVTVRPDTAECMVTRSTPGQPIIEGDIVVNLAFERNRKPKFVVRGSFDLNYDGVIDANDIERVSALIRDWGGQVVAELDETTDFVVVGVAPAVPRVLPGVPVSPVVQVQVERQKLARTEFAGLIEKAKTLNIPVITQSQLLFLTGYAGETAARQR